MANNETSEAVARGRIGLIQAITTPLGFFVLVVLIVEGILTVFVFKLDAGADLTFVLRCMIVVIVALVLIVTGIAIWRPWVLSGKETKYSLLIGPLETPEKLREWDITVIKWDDDNCFLVCGSLNLEEKISLVPSRRGPTFRVTIPPKILDKVREEAVVLKLKDRKGNRWEVGSFYLYENLLPLSMIETRAKIVEDYEDENQ